MGAIGAGAKAGKEEGQKKGQKVGSKSDPNNGRIKEDAKSFGKGAASGAMAGAGKGAVKGAVEDGKKGAQIGGKALGSIPYAGAVLGPIGAALGGTVGGAIGAGAGATSGALTGAGVGGSEAVKEAEKNRAANRNKSGYRKYIGNIFDNLKQLTSSDQKKRTRAARMLAIKFTLIGIIAVFVFFGAIIEAIAEESSKHATEAVTSVLSGAETEVQDLYKNSGSLLLVTDEDIEKISEKYINSLERTNKGYYKALTQKYSGKNSATVANKVTHITTNFESKETEELSQITEPVKKVSGEARLSDERTIFEHILRAEKYNFNSIIWRSYVKDGKDKDGNDKVKSQSIDFQVDKDSKLKYPSKDENDTDKEFHELDFFTKAKAYLQSWYIPFDLMIGTQDSQDYSNLNTKFAYEIMASAYHEIVMDRYKLENLIRELNYRVYDKTTTVTTTTRVCNDYSEIKGSETIKDIGDPCSKSDKASGLCKDWIVKYKDTMDCKQKDYKPGGKCADKDNHSIMVGPVMKKCSNIDNLTLFNNNCKDTYEDWVNCTDSDFSSGAHGCTYGTIATKVTTPKTVISTYCVDIEKEKVTHDYDQREALVDGTPKSSVAIKDTDERTYRWNYIISLAKTFDSVMSNEYKFTAFKEYGIDNFNKYIDDSGKYKEAGKYEEGVSKFVEQEKKDSEADTYTHNEENYNPDPKETTDIIDLNWNVDNLVFSIPSGATLISGTHKEKNIIKITKIEKEGKTYNDEYIWDDKLEFEDTKSGIYNVDSIKDVTGDDLTASDEDYYRRLYNKQDINLIDLINSYDGIYKEYLSIMQRKSNTSNIGMSRSSLDVSYIVLKKDLKDLIGKHQYNGLKYGKSIGVSTDSFELASGVSLGDVENIAGVNLDGKNVTFPFDFTKYKAIKASLNRARRFIWICRT